jgi:hypothetical protein
MEFERTPGGTLLPKERTFTVTGVVAGDQLHVAAVLDGHVKPVVVRAPRKYPHVVMHVGASDALAAFHKARTIWHEQMLEEAAEAIDAFQSRGDAEESNDYDEDVAELVTFVARLEANPPTVTDADATEWPTAGPEALRRVAS